MGDKRILQDVRRVARDVLRDYHVDVYLFGSWASGTQRRTSDIDIAVDPHQRLPEDLLATLREQLEESPIPYRVEVVDLRDVDRTFRQAVIRQGIRWSV
jgi:predicted nucleotidyltransferase